MKTILECENCGCTMELAWTQEWGRTKETDGGGGIPRCLKLVENPYAPPAVRNGGTSSAEIIPRDIEPPMQFCGGSLQRVEVPDDVKVEVRRLTAIQPGKTS